MLSIAERHKYILDSLEKYGFIRIADVADELKVTKVTIRKDVKILESRGLLYKVHGSARPANPHVADRDLNLKSRLNREAKKLIAKRAAEMIEDNDSIMFSAGLDDICPRRGDPQQPAATLAQRRNPVPEGLGAAQ